MSLLLQFRNALNGVLSSAQDYPLFRKGGVVSG